MKTANQLYKESNTTMPFKEWLTEQKKSGTLDNAKEKQDAMYENIDGEKRATIEIFGINIKYILIGALVLGAGYMAYRYYKNRQ